VTRPELTPDSAKGSLAIVGIGIRFGLQTTPEALESIERAEKVLFLFSDPASAGWIQRQNASAESLEGFYTPGKPRTDIYDGLVEEILAWVRKGLGVCVVFYGHPGVFAEPAHESIRRAREEGFPARMLPAVSAEDCLFADLGVDPGDGCQSYEATDFLLRPPVCDPNVSLVLWQVAGVGTRVGRTEPARDGLRVLAEWLVERYGPEHEIVLYEAPTLPIGGPSINRALLCDLAKSEVTAMTTLYVPPKGRRGADEGMFDRLGISRADDY
jgi:uncharacterized protein YabN with tetrapyrrole methylase and pyrophosphatase domain